MRNSKYINNIIFTSSILFSLGLANYISSQSTKPPIFISRQNSSINFDKKVWDLFHFGQKRLISSLYWIATILESDVEHYKKKDLNSWMFLRFETITFLEPKFLETYTFGGPYLSIIKDDIPGASLIYQKGLEHYPSNYQLLKNAAFHFHFEAEDYVTAARVLKLLKAQPNVNPLLLTSLARIESSQGNLDNAFIVLSEIYNQLKVKNNPLAYKILSNLYAIKAEKDLECLNLEKNNCNHTDLSGNKYFKNNLGKYVALESWSPYRIKKKAAQN